MSRRKRECRKYRCTNEPYLGGLCREHDEEEFLERERRSAALLTLETGGVEGRLPDNLDLRQELMQLRERFFRARSVLQAERGTESMPLDEAEYAIAWCFRLAHEIRVAEIGLRNGRAPGWDLESTRSWVWDRFRNLEAGRRSNGLPR